MLSGSSLAFLTLLAALVIPAYLGLCVLWPLKLCRACRGRGRFQSRVLRGVRVCLDCDASGLQLRAGTRALAAIRESLQARRNRNNRR
ncbi:hypothetical protein [Saccharopolyspora taberi]|uniref:Uncharacterized protein n=1 Tax=Saccharopolyspora taberi TaxID=60895 RepID=A0ABN3V4N1_9PSEU